MDIRRRLALNLKRLRQEKGWSQEAFAHHAGLHRTYASAVERGVRNPTITVLERLAKGLGVAAAELIAETPNDPAEAGPPSPAPRRPRKG